MAFFKTLTINGFPVVLASNGMADGIVIRQENMDMLDNKEYIKAVKIGSEILPFLAWVEYMEYYGVDGYLSGLNFRQYESELKRLSASLDAVHEHGLEHQNIIDLEYAVAKLNRWVSNIDQFEKQEFERMDNELFRKNRKIVYNRDGGACRYCGKKLGRSYSVDHVIPKIQGGTSEITNLVLCCRSCNSRKGGRTPEEAGMELL